MISKNFSSLLFKEWKPLFYTMLPNDNSAEREKLLLFLYHIENSESLREGNFWFEFQKFLRDKIVQLDGETKKIVLAWLYNMLDKDLMRVGSPLDVIYEILTTFSETDPWYVCDFWKMLETKLIANFHRD